ncbi:MAG: hypothetical protein JSV27_03625 [Candidatus Bathyarchaeota archaeon]|nr:MAG: hypothetical protein JSV27_03625 [Candidatus Bathyarchaeota archaeon]
MKSEELLKEIEACKRMLEGYRSYGQFVGEAIDAFSRLSEIIGDPSEESLKEGLKLAETLLKEMNPYRAYVPRIGIAIDEILKWIQDNQ